jgi:hypothetical protein
MKIIKIALIALVFLGIPAVAYFGYKSLNKIEKDADTVSETAKIISENENIKTNIQELIKEGKPIKCSYNVTTDQGSSSGIFYVSGEDMRTESKVVAGDTTTESYVIKKGEIIYMWDPKTLSGYQMAATEEMIDNDIESYESAEIPDIMKDINTNMDYDCDTWIIDNSMFDLPENVTFMDLSTLGEQMQESQEPGDLCAMCEELPDEQKSACLENFGCN